MQAVRTSSTAWCDPHSCQRDPILAAVRRRIANLTLVPERNAEHLQVLKYDTGQFYKTHHDQNSPTTSYWGPRMYTFFMYLNDCEGGGQTHFPRLNISVAPRRGRALLWPSVLNEDPNLRDDRTEHEAVAVSAGRKYAANYWLHMYDFQLANDRGCGNTEVFGCAPRHTPPHHLPTPPPHFHTHMPRLKTGDACARARAHAVDGDFARAPRSQVPSTRSPLPCRCGRGRLPPPSRQELAHEVTR